MELITIAFIAAGLLIALGTVWAVSERDWKTAGVGAFLVTMTLLFII